MFLLLNLNKYILVGNTELFCTVFLLLSPFQPSVAFHKETSHLICTTNQLLGFYIAIILRHFYIQSKYGSLQKIKPLCLNMFYTIINDTKRKRQNTFFFILHIFPYIWQIQDLTGHCHHMPASISKRGE